MNVTSLKRKNKNPHISLLTFKTFYPLMKKKLRLDQAGYKKGIFYKLNDIEDIFCSKY